MFHDSDFEDVSFLTKHMLMCHVCLHWLIFFHIKGSVFSFPSLFG